MARHALRLTLDGAGQGTVELDGEPLRGVRGVTLSADVHHLPVLTVDVGLREVELMSGDTEVLVSEAAAESLLRLGWTPPPSPAEAGEG
jgi:hypothetical protein